MKIPLYNLEGKKTQKTVTLKPDFFEIKVNPVLVQEAVVAQRSKARTVLAHTKTRSERRGGGAKPWRQKGTGRARAGSRRSPIWRKGGVTFGPRKDRNYTKKINRKARRKAILMVLSDRAKSKDIVVLEKLKIARGKTKELVSFISKFPVKPKCLVLVSGKNDVIRRAGKNLSKVKILASKSLNVVDLLNYDCILMPKEAIKDIENTFLVKS